MPQHIYIAFVISSLLRIRALGLGRLPHYPISTNRLTSLLTDFRMSEGYRIWMWAESLVSVILKRNEMTTTGSMGVTGIQQSAVVWLGSNTSGHRPIKCKHQFVINYWKTIINGIINLLEVMNINECHHSDDHSSLWWIIVAYQLAPTISFWPRFQEEEVHAIIFFLHKISYLLFKS